MENNENIHYFNHYNDDEEKSFHKSSKTKRKNSIASLMNFLIFIVIITTYLNITSAAPAAPYSKFKSPREKGCYYLLKHYENGQEIETNEPCLNCTCLNSMLMCYLRVCPYVRPLGDRCIIERIPGQCCPRITCPDSSVEATTPEPEEGNELGCYIDGEHYKEGAQIPSDPSKPCEVCYCIRNTSSCVVQECTLKVSGCQPQFSSDSCCPTRYNCSEEAATTVPPGLLHPSSPQLGCRANGKNFLDGEAVPSRDACEHCYCMKNEIVCAVQECKAPCEGCVPIPSDNDQCCPERYECAAPTRVTNSSSFQDIITTTTDVPTSVKEESSPTASALQVKSETSTSTPVPEVITKSPVVESRVVLIPSQPRRDEPGQSRRRPFPSVGVIPGEGICRHEGRVYQNGDEVLSRNPCVEYCMCINSVVYCDETVCTEPKVREGNCTRVKLPTDCCPRYECHSPTTTTLPTTTTTSAATTAKTTEMTTLGPEVTSSTTITEFHTTTTVATTISTASSPTTSVLMDLTTVPPQSLDDNTSVPPQSLDGDRSVPVSEESVEQFSTTSASSEIEVTTHDISSSTSFSVDAQIVEKVPTTSAPEISSSTLSSIEKEMTTSKMEVEKVSREPISDVVDFSDEIVVPTKESVAVAEENAVTTALPIIASENIDEDKRDSASSEEVFTEPKVETSSATAKETTTVSAAPKPTTIAPFDEIHESEQTTVSPIIASEHIDEDKDDRVSSEEVFTESRVETSSAMAQEMTTVTAAPKPVTNGPHDESHENGAVTTLPEISRLDETVNEISTKLPELVTTTEKMDEQPIQGIPVDPFDAPAEIVTEKPTASPLEPESHKRDAEKPIETTTIVSLSTSTESEEVVKVDDDNIEDIQMPTTQKVSAEDSTIAVTTVITPISPSSLERTSVPPQPLDEGSSGSVSEESVEEFSTPKVSNEIEATTHDISSSASPSMDAEIVETTSAPEISSSTFSSMEIEVTTLRIEDEKVSKKPVSDGRVFSDETTVPSDPVAVVEENIVTTSSPVIASKHIDEDKHDRVLSEEVFTESRGETSSVTAEVMTTVTAAPQPATSILLDKFPESEAAIPDVSGVDEKVNEIEISTQQPELVTTTEKIGGQHDVVKPIDSTSEATVEVVTEKSTSNPFELERHDDDARKTVETTTIVSVSAVSSSSTELSAQTEPPSRIAPKEVIQPSSSTAQPFEETFEPTTLATPISLNISSNGTADYLLKEVTSSPMMSTIRPIGSEQLADSESNKILEDDDGSCVFEGKVFQSAEQIPRPHPCDFCFCFRGDIICLQQTCPPPIPRCYETPIQGFCCPRYECPVQSTSSSSNATTPRSVESPKGCQVNGTFYEIGERVQQASGPCLECKCDHSGLMQCNPQTCSPPAPLLLRMNRDFFASTIRR